MSSAPKKAEKSATTTRPKARGMTSGRLLHLYEAAISNGTTHQAFLAYLVAATGYKNKTAAAARLGRLRRELAGRGLSLVPLPGARLGRSNKALQATYAACLVK